MSLHSLSVVYQVNQRLHVPLPLMNPTVFGPLGDVVHQATKFAAEKHGSYSLGIKVCDVSDPIKKTTRSY